MKANFTFIAELNDFLPRNLKSTTFGLEFAPHQSLKHLIESLGVPHTDFGKVLVNDQETNPDQRLREGDQVTIYPAKGSILGVPHFILDNHLGQLATYMRMLGFDTLYRNDFQDDELSQVASQDERVLLTRDRRLLMRKVIRLGYCIHQTDPRLQAVEVLKRFQLQGQVRPFQRCLRCNSPLQVVSKQDILERLEPLTKIYYDEFHFCPSCKQIYWKGSHYGHMLEMIEAMAAQV
ncbi:MAG TPA: Mut7-C RNAse domain-containing protein [Anaerolineales bacterium]|nr:Mut7-C RNAse domain-containing protein [Anaerolineales bacterium]